MTPEPEAPAPRRVEVSNRTLLTIVLILFGIWLLREVLPVVVVVIAALMITGTVSPIVDMLLTRGFKRWAAVTIVFLTALIVLGALTALTAPTLLGQVAEFIGHLPLHQSQLVDSLRQHPVLDAVADVVSSYDFKGATSHLDMASALTFSGNLVELLGYGVTSVVLAIYFVSDPETTRGGLYAVVPRRFHVRLSRIVLNLELIVGGYIRGQLLTSLFIGAFVLVLLTVLGIPNAVALATFAAIADVLPFVGGLLATAPPVLLALQKGPGVAGLVFVSMVAYQELESRVIVPRVYGTTLRLPSAAIVVALLVGGRLGGIVGALLALPFAAGLRMMAEELRVALPGDDSAKEVEQARDALAEQVYNKASAGASAQEAAKVALRIAGQQNELQAAAVEAEAADKKDTEP